MNPHSPRPRNPERHCDEEVDRPLISADPRITSRATQEAAASIAEPFRSRDRGYLLVEGDLHVEVNNALNYFPYALRALSIWHDRRREPFSGGASRSQSKFQRTTVDPNHIRMARSSHCLKLSAYRVYRIRAFPWLRIP